MAANTEWGWFEWLMTVAAGAIGGLIKLVWGMLSARIKQVSDQVKANYDEQGQHIGKHYSEINDSKNRLTVLETQVEIHTKLAEERNRAVIEQLRSMDTDFKVGLNKVETRMEEMMKGISSEIKELYERRRQQDHGEKK